MVEGRCPLAVDMLKATQQGTAPVWCGCQLGCTTWGGVHYCSPSGKYNWTVRVRRRCGLMSHYFDHLFLCVAADIWSVGCIMAELMLRRPLFPGNNCILYNLSSSSPFPLPLKLWPCGGIEMCFIIVTISITPHRPYCVRRCGLLLPTELRGLSVCRSVCHTSQPCKNGWSDRDAVWIEDSGVPREPCIRSGSRSPMWRGNFDGEGASHCKVYGHSAVICAKVAEPIEMPFGLWDRMGPRNHLLDDGPDPPWEGTIFGEWGTHCKASAVRCAKMAELIDLPFRLWTWVGQRKHKFNRICQVAPMCPHERAHWRHVVNTIEPPVFGGDVVFLCHITLTTC